MTLLVALDWPTAVKFPPVATSRVILRKKRLTTLSGTTALRGSKDSQAFAALLAGDEDCPEAVSDTVAIITINNGRSGLACNPLCGLLACALILQYACCPR